MVLFDNDNKCIYCKMPNVQIKQNSCFLLCKTNIKHYTNIEFNSFIVLKLDVYKHR